MKRTFTLIAAVVAAALVFVWFVREPAWDWSLPGDVPAPQVPADNPMSSAKVELGRWLFYDIRLSGNETMS